MIEAAFKRTTRLVLLALIAPLFLVALAAPVNAATLSTYTTPPAPSRVGYTFTGWQINNTGPLIPANTETTLPITTETIVISAKWTPKSVAFSYALNSGSGGSAAPGSANSDSFFTLASAPTRPGYTFTGWKISDTGTLFDASASAKMPASNNPVLIHAKWSADTLTVTLNSQGGTGVSGTATTTTDSSLSNPGTPSKTGYSFSGWFTAANGGSKANFPYAHGQTANFTIYAQWIADTLTITYDNSSGLTVTAGDESTTASSTISSLREVSRAGYNFNGWFT